MMDNEETITLRRKDFFRILRTIAIHEKHILDLFRQTHGMKEYKFEQVLKETAEDFGVPYEELENINFERFEHGN